MHFIILRSINLLYRGLVSYTPLALFWIIGGLVMHPVAKKISWRQLPKVADKLALIVKPSRNKSEFGKITGEIQEHKVIITPDKTIKIRLFFVSEHKIDFSTSKPYVRPTKDMPDFNTNNWKFNTIFKTRRASPELATKINQCPELTASLVKFYTQWIWRLTSIHIENKYISCGLNYGDPFNPYLPADVLENIFSDLMHLAQQIDRSF